MGRNNAHALNSIRMLCRMQQVDEKVLYERAKLILSIYRDVCWSTVGRADEVHDELIFDVALQELDDIKAIVRREMEHAIDLSVPLVVDMGTGRSWLEAH